MVKPAPDLNLEELERRLRSDDPNASMAEDPLAELTRLIESFDAPSPHATGSVVDLASRRAIGIAGRAPSTAPALGGGMELRGPLSAEAPGAEVSAADDGGFDELAFEESAEPTDEFAESPVAQARPPRRWLMRSLVLIALGLAAGGYYAYSKGGFSVASKAPPTILAATTPAKVQPQRVETAESTDDATAILRKSQAAAPAVPAKIVGGQEQPVDVKTQLAMQPPPAAPAAADGVNFTQNPPSPASRALAALDVPAPSPAAPAPVASIAPASQVPAPQVPAPQVAAPQVAAAPANPPAPQFPAPTKQHSVVIRPDGSLVTDAKAPASAAPAPAPPAKAAADAVNLAPQSATPKLDIASKPPTKSVARVDAAKPAPAAAAAAPAGAPLQLSPVASGVDKPAKAAAAKAADAAAPVVLAAPAVDGQVATPANPTAQADGAKGSWRAQLAAPHSQAEADAMVAKLQGKYAAALDGAALSVHKADVNGTSVYRVSASGLAKASALDLCGKVQGAGGDCFTARN